MYIFANISVLKTLCKIYLIEDYSWENKKKKRKKKKASD